MLPPLTLSFTLISFTLLPALHAVDPPPPTGPRHAPTGPRHQQTQQYRNPQASQTHKSVTIPELQEPDILELHRWNFKDDENDEDLRAKIVSTNHGTGMHTEEEDIKKEIQKEKEKEKDEEEMSKLAWLWVEDRRRDIDLRQTIHHEPTELVFGKNRNLKHMMQGFDNEIVKVFKALAVVGTNIHWKKEQGMSSHMRYTIRLNLNRGGYPSWGASKNASV